MIFLLSFTGLSAAGLFLVIHAACFAPLGEEDAHGFHFVTSADAKTTTADERAAVEHGGLSIVSR